VKARKVKLDPDAPLGGSILAILSVRLDELYSFAAAAKDVDEVDALHDMRIAAKRVRYILEAAEPVFGQPAERGAKTMEQLQDLLGDIHDCDELLPLLARHVEKLRSEDAAAAAAGEPLPNRRKYRGLEALRAHTLADRERLYARFARKWTKLERDAFRARLELELARAGVPV
jgi:CHAD domain-containing protein